jgi:hypothetical protein
MTDQVMTETDEHLSSEDRVLAKLRRRLNEDLARKPPEPAMWPVIVIGLAAGAAMLAAGSVFAKFFL